MVIYQKFELQTLKLPRYILIITFVLTKASRLLVDFVFFAVFPLFSVESILLSIHEIFAWDKHKIGNKNSNLRIRICLVVLFNLKNTLQCF